MTVFVVVALTSNPMFEAAIMQSYPDDHLKLTDTVWLVSASGTSRTVSDELKISEGEVGSGMIFSTAGYFGRSSPSNWEWISNKLRVTGG
jgi:hypothetical protein